MSINEWSSTSTPRSVSGGIKPANSYRDFATTWWGKRWIEVLESLYIGQRLLRGRRYARAGQVMEINIKNNKIYALVQGRRLTPYEVIIEFKRWNNEIRSKIINIIMSNGYLLGPIFARELPKELEILLCKEGINLFPNAYEELKTNCTCSDWSNPCKHIVAVLYLLALEFDRDPTLILQLRGLCISDIKNSIDEIKDNEKEEVKKLAEEQKNTFSQLLKTDKKKHKSNKDKLALSDLELIPKPPPINALNIKRLGVPPFWRSDIEFIKFMEKLYKNFSICGRDKII